MGGIWMKPSPWPAFISRPPVSDKIPMKRILHAMRAKLLQRLCEICRRRAPAFAGLTAGPGRPPRMGCTMSFFGKPTGGEPRITYERIDLTADGSVLPPSRPEQRDPPAPVLRAAPPATTPVIRRHGNEAPPMLIAADSEMEGRLRSRGAVRIEGVLRGELHAASLVLEPGGLIEGLVTVEHAHLNGTLRGTVVAKDIEISRTAMVEAELVYEEIGIERGARVRGLHRRRDPEPEPQEAEALSLSMTANAEADIVNGPDRRPGGRRRSGLAGTGRGGPGRRRRLGRTGAGRYHQPGHAGG
jgi:cytoskeletal protein CcmA (bactofilin family)